MRLRAVLALALVLPAACGDGDGASKPRLTVSAAASLKAAFTAYGKDFTPSAARFSFAGSDELAAQIRQGARPDVYAAADTQLPRRLFAEGRVGRPVAFARNRLVLAVPAGSGIASVDDLARPGVKLAMGAEGVPIGDYAREVLARLPRPQSRAILANVRSNEPDVAGVVGKLSQGAADAGFVYATDVRAAGGGLRALELPLRLRPRVTYAIAVVSEARRPREARAFIDGLLWGAGRAAMRRAGFESPPRP